MRRDAFLAALTFAAGATEGIVFLRFDVLTAVMTGNLVLLGAALGRGAMENAARSLFALAGYALGVVIGARATGPSVATTSSRAVTRAFAIECALQAAFLVGWLLARAAPEGAGAAILIVLSGAAMGIQATVVQVLGSRVSTTYVTATFTHLVRHLTSLSGLGTEVQRQATAVLALVAGAIAGALALVVVPAAAPAIPLVVVAVVTLLGSRAPLVEHR